VGVHRSSRDSVDVCGEGTTQRITPMAPALPV
jgi:hypothetical protein